jgi:O-antigen/teichoic acid export membrane protein
MTASSGSNIFVRRVSTVFGAKIVVFGLGLMTTVVVSRLLGPTGKGAYVAVTALPAMLGAIGTFGLPGAINYYSARGASVSRLLRSSIVFVAVIAAVSVAVLWRTLPWLESSVLRAAPDDMLRVILIAIPAGMLASFVGTILYGRNEVKLYTSIMIGQSIATLVILVLFVGVLRLGVPGAVWGSVTISCLGALAVLAAVRHVGRRHPEGTPASARSLMSYGLRAYPAGITGYFNYRADTFLIQALMLNAAGPLGLYSMAVTMAELIFYIPDSVTTIFLPTVAGSTPEEADAKLGRVSRLTMLVTVSCSLALVPAAWIGLHLVLPGFVDCMPAFLVLLPGVVSLSLGKVLTTYLAGRGRPGVISIGAGVTLVLNLVANIFLIPAYGIVGAAAASLISYTAMTAMMLVVACRLSGHSPFYLIVPGKTEVRVIWTAGRRGLAMIGRRVRPATPRP